jgi:hypothetical protein
MDIKNHKTMPQSLAENCQYFCGALENVRSRFLQNVNNFLSDYEAQDSNLKHSLELKGTSQHKHTPMNGDNKIIQQ